MNTNTRLIPNWVEPTANDIDNIRKEIERILEKYGQISLAECKGLICRPKLIGDYIRGWYAPCQVDMIFKKLNAKTCKWIIEMPPTVDISATAHRREEIDNGEQIKADIPDLGRRFPTYIPANSAIGEVVAKNIEEAKKNINAVFGVNGISSDIDIRESIAKVQSLKKKAAELVYEHDKSSEPIGDIISTDDDKITVRLRKDALDTYPQMLDWMKANPAILKDQEMKRDNGKPRLALVPPSLIESVGKILTFGADKYEPNGWKRVAPERYKDAMVRHLCAYLRDENSVDEESGLPHLWHMTCNAAFLIDFKEQEKKGEYDATHRSICEQDSPNE